MAQRLWTAVECTIAREASHKSGNPVSAPVLLDQARKADPPAPLTAMARDVEHGQLALQLAKRD